MKASIFLQNLHHAYAQTDGTYAFPNSREGDMLKQAKREIEASSGQWIHCDERLPEDGATVWFYRAIGTYRLVMSGTFQVYHEDCAFVHEHGMHYWHPREKVTHWMPRSIPQPPAA